MQTTPGFKADNDKTRVSILPTQALRPVGARFATLCKEESMIRSPDQHLIVGAWRGLVDGVEMQQKHQARAFVDGAAFLALCMIPLARRVEFMQGNPQNWFLPMDVLHAVYRVMRVPLVSGKYVIGDWQQVRPMKRYADAAMRHLLQHQAGEVLDESGEPHLAHSFTSTLIVIHQLECGVPMGEYDFQRQS